MLTPAPLVSRNAYLVSPDRSCEQSLPILVCLDLQAYLLDIQAYVQPCTTAQIPTRQRILAFKTSGNTKDKSLPETSILVQFALSREPSMCQPALSSLVYPCSPSAPSLKCTWGPACCGARFLDPADPTIVRPHCFWAPGGCPGASISDLCAIGGGSHFGLGWGWALLVYWRHL